MKIYLLRHGETAYNQAHITQDVANDIDITSEAKREIDDARDELNNELREAGCEVAYTSTMLRAKRTLQRLIFAHDTPINCMLISAMLDEVDFGVFNSQQESFAYDGKTMDDYRHDIMHAYEVHGNVSYPKGEDLLSIKQRCGVVIQNLRDLKANGHEAVLLVGHNRFFRHLLVELGVWTPERMFDNKLPHAKLFYAGDI